ncbi:MAG TPA: glycosyltransferase, partial [Anaerolineaceae bacterium]
PGYVPDLAPWFAQAALVVVPVQVGGGMRVRILEAFARGMPVVTTTVGLEGIAARASEDVLVEDDPAGFAAAVVRILENPALQQALSRRGRQVAELYDWKAVLKEMGDIYAGFEEQTTGADADAAVLRSLMAGRIHAE